jgi:hypothetical protein
MGALSPITPIAQVDRAPPSKKAIMMPVKLNYEKYIRSSSKWKTICVQIRNRDDNKCKLCDSTEKLHVHHLTYKRLGNERPEDLVTLCELCHSDQHKLANTIRINDKRFKGDKNKSITQAWAATKRKAKPPKGFINRQKKICKARRRKKQTITEKNSKALKLRADIKPSKLLKLMKKYLNISTMSPASLREAAEILSQEFKRRKIKIADRDSFINTQDNKLPQ